MTAEDLTKLEKPISSYLPRPERDFIAAEALMLSTRLGYTRPAAFAALLALALALGLKGVLLPSFEGRFLPQMGFSDGIRVGPLTAGVAWLGVGVARGG